MVLRCSIATGVLFALALVSARLVGWDGIRQEFSFDLGDNPFFKLSLAAINLRLSDIDTVLWGLLYLTGLAWMVYLVELLAHRIEQQRALAELRSGTDTGPSGIPISGEIVTPERSWNPLDAAARYYEPTSLIVRFLFVGAISLAAVFAILPMVLPNSLPSWLNFNEIPSIVCAALIAVLFILIVEGRLRQSLISLGAYSLFFFLMYLLAHLHLRGEKHEVYDLPAGGGSEMPQASAMKVQKIVRKKYVFNPFSSVIFNNPPPIDQVQLELEKETANQYQAGQGTGLLGDGDGEGGGFGKGKAKGKIRFIRLKHPDTKWDKNMGIGKDQNLLAEFVARHPEYKGKMGEATEWKTIGELGNFGEKQSPPVVYVCGASSFTLTDTEKKTLQKYLIERHGMILGDDLAGQGFKQAFINVMNQITGVSYVTISRDDIIHQRPHNIPQLPIVVAHGGTTALGWKVDGRWVAYYHPGALSDAWTDDHAGIKKPIADQCYMLGINILYYSHREYNQWLQSQGQ
jgi:hypothetical protein